MEPIRLAIVDDHDLFREGIKLVLGQLEGVDLVFDTSDGYRFIEELKCIRIDLVLMDIEMPALSGFETTIRALQAQPDLRVIALTMFSDTGHYVQMIHAGVRGFILKKSGKQELAEAISTVSQGGSYISQEILHKLDYNRAGPAGDTEFLTGRELEIMLLICKGLTTQEISDKLFISIKTVETHRGNIFLKSGVRNTAGLIVWAIRNHYFTIE
jgi:DNA-binding NarL/FixJ family response regulator